MLIAVYIAFKSFEAKNKNQKNIFLLSFLDMAFSSTDG